MATSRDQCGRFVRKVRILWCRGCGGADLLEPVGAMSEDIGHVGEGFDVIDNGGAAEQA
jgi:hypothetical protein